MATFCLDTDVIVGMLRGTEQLQRLLSIAPLGVSTTIISLLELYYGAYKSGREANISRVESIGKDLNIMELTKQDAMLAGRMMASLEKAGKKLDFRDVTIAAICINSGMALVTRNRRHFSRMERFGLALADW